MNRNFGKPQFDRGLESCVSGDNNGVTVNDNRLSEPKLPQTGGNGVDRLVIQPGVSLVGFDGMDDLNGILPFGTH